MHYLDTSSLPEWVPFLFLDPHKLITVVWTEDTIDSPRKTSCTPFLHLSFLHCGDDSGCCIVKRKVSYLHSLTEGKKKNRMKDYTASLGEQRSGIFRVENLGATSGPHPRVPQPHGPCANHPHIHNLLHLVVILGKVCHTSGLKIYYSFLCERFRILGFFFSSSEHVK